MQVRERHGEQIIVRRFGVLAIALGLVLATAGVVPGGAPAGYYDAAAGLRGAALESALRGIIDGHNALSYDGAKDRLWDTVDPEGGVITCIYTGRTTTNLNADSDGMNAEHTWPQSRGAGSTPPRSDLHHLFVVDADWNSRRGSLRFDTVSSPTATSPNGSKVNSSVGFEPATAFKGDVARVIFYFAVRYDKDVRNGAVLGGNDNSTTDDHMGELDELIAWHFADPPSTHERNRNDRIYAIQGNRNPFIDNPDYVTDWFELGDPIPQVVAATSPAVPRSTSAVTITAQITSTVAVNTETVRTQWRIGSSGAFTPIAMTRQSGTNTNGSWSSSTTIPAQAAGTRVEYYVEAADTAGTAGRDPQAGTKFYITQAPSAPTVTASVLPVAPRAGDSIFLRAAIQSSDPINAATVLASYETSTAQSGTLSMNLVSGTTTNGTWQSVSALNLAAGTVLSYAVSATDTASLSSRDPAAGFRTVEVAAVPTELNVSGYTLTDTNANIAVTFPTGTIIPAGGFLIVSRQATQSQFETVWGALPQGTQFLNSFSIVGGNGLVINGGEILTLKNAAQVVIDGPTATTGLNASNARVARSSTAANTWAAGTAAQADPGELTLAPSGAGLIITEYSDPVGTFQEAFVEIYYDAPAAAPAGPDIWIVH
jgi:endonuclease I